MTLITMEIIFSDKNISCEIFHAFPHKKCVTKWNGNLHDPIH